MNGLPSLRRCLGSLRRDARGVTVVEFAMVLPVLLLVIMGGMDMGYQAYVRSVLQGALNDIARTGSLEAPDLACTTGTVEERIACSIRRRSDVVAPNATYDFEIRSYYEFSGVGRAEKLVTDHNRNGQYDTGDCFADLNGNREFDASAGRGGIGGADDVVFYRVDMTMPRLFPVSGMLGWSPDYEISATTAIRNQPYSQQQVPPTVCV